jgi:hypothetical protein
VVAGNFWDEENGWKYCRTCQILHGWRVRLKSFYVVERFPC